MRIENIAGEYAIVDSGTGAPVSGEQRYKQLNFAEDRLRALKDAAKEAALESEPVRARDKKGRLVGDDPDTPDVNEAYVGGKAPAKKKSSSKKKKPAAKKKAPAKKKAVKK